MLAYDNGYSYNLIIGCAIVAIWCPDTCDVADENYLPDVRLYL